MTDALVIYVVKNYEERGRRGKLKTAIILVFGG
jgi:hypothetical protein